MPEMPNRKSVALAVTEQLKRAGEPSAPEIEAEAARLFEKLGKISHSLADCRKFAKLTLKINRLKKLRNATILAHNYQRPEIIFGIADFVGDSLGLSVNAAGTDADEIVFCGVRFMAETAKILSPKKKVLLPDTEAGCSLAESITAKDIRELKRQHPDAAVVCYVNTTAAIKAESDICCTSANIRKVLDSLPNKKVIFVPDEFMAKNVAETTDKEIIRWKGRCIVHETFREEMIGDFREKHPGLKVLSHLECSPSVIGISDMAGSTSEMIDFVRKSDAKDFLLATECGLSEMMQANFPEKNFAGTCQICPYMKKINLENVLKALENGKFGITVPEKTRRKAKKSLARMMALA